MLPKLLKVEKDRVVNQKNKMSKYNLSELLTEIVGGRIGTLNISARDLVSKMDGAGAGAGAGMEKPADP